MKLLTKPIHEQLLRNGRLRLERIEQELPEIDFLPVVKFFTPDANCTWLLSELDPEDGDTAFGLCDLGLGSPELGYFSLSELASVRGKLGLPVERDRHFYPDKTVSAYAEEARASGCITA